MDLTCYLHPGWEPLIRPAKATRDWMDQTPESFAYRCLPLDIANAHGWEVLTPFAFDACWNGGISVDDIDFRLPDGVQPDLAPVSIFGQGVLTFHIFGLFRTPKGWNLWVSGPPNQPKDGIYPLTGVIETDWAPYTFTMNWRFTRPNHWIHFDAQEPTCFLFPVQRAYLEQVKPRFVSMDSDAELMGQFRMWCKSREEFQASVSQKALLVPSDKWQKYYYRGLDMEGRCPAADHRTKLRLAEFSTAGSAAPAVTPPHQALDSSLSEPVPPSNGDQSSSTPLTADHSQMVERLAFEISRGLLSGDGSSLLAGRLTEAGLTDTAARNIVEHALADPVIHAARESALQKRKRDWLLESMEQHQQLTETACQIERHCRLTGQDFLEHYYAPGRPVILVGELSEWPALARWTPRYLREAVGSRVIEYQGGRTANKDFELYKDLHRREMPFDKFIDLISDGSTGNDAYLTAYNSKRNHDALSVLYSDLGFLDEFLSRDVERPHGMMWIGPAGTVTSLHHDLTDNFIAQFVGRKRLKLIAAADVGKLDNYKHVFSRMADLEDPNLDRSQFPLLPEARVYDIVLNPGEILFVPLGWWHQVKSLDFSVTTTYTNFLWRNDWYRRYPTE
jgi:hypothetical protein